MSEIERQEWEFEWENLLRNNAVVKAAHEAGAEPRRIVAVLAKQNELLMERLMELELIAPRQHILPDGTTYTYRCPEWAIPKTTEDR